MTRPRYTRSVANAAQKLLKVLAGCPAHERVDWRAVTEMCLVPREQSLLEEAFIPWLRLNFGITDGLIHWAFNRSTTTTEVASKLRLFHGVVTTILDAATIMQDAAVYLKTFGWIQGQPGGASTGFDLVGAVAAACDASGASQPLRLVVLEGLRDYLAKQLGALTPLTEWNDTPGRTPYDVLHLLSACADETLTIDAWR